MKREEREQYTIVLFAETGQASMRHNDVTLREVLKVGMPGLLWEAFRGEREWAFKTARKVML